MNQLANSIAGRRARFAHVDTWVFDLDNTLYPHGSDVWPQIDARITLFLTNLFGIDGLSARGLQKYYYERYGTTLKGLMTDDGIAPEAFLDFVHDVDRSSLQPDPALGAAISALPGRKLIMTNGSREHALRTARQLGIADIFEGVFDIVAADLVPKPEAAAFEMFFAKHDVDPRRAAMFEDIAKNLIVPHQRGMVTTLVLPGPENNQAGEDAARKSVDFTTENLAAFLRGLTQTAVQFTPSGAA